MDKEVLLEYQLDTILDVLDANNIGELEFINDLVGFGFRITAFISNFTYENEGALRVFANNCDPTSLKYLHLLGEIKIKMDELENRLPKEQL